MNARRDKGTWRRRMGVGMSDETTRVSIADVLARVERLQAEGNFDEALRWLRTSASALFGPVALTLQQVDAQSAARLLGSVERICEAAALSAHEGGLAELRGQGNEALACRRKALMLYLEAIMLGCDAGQVRAAIASLRPKADEWRLGERYRAALASL
jgi:hypothetical protein